MASTLFRGALTQKPLKTVQNSLSDLRQEKEKQETVCGFLLDGRIDVRLVLGAGKDGSLQHRIFWFHFLTSFSLHLIP